MKSTYTLHDVSKFPIVKLRPEACVPGFGAGWGREMTALVGEQQPYVIIYEPEAMVEEPADYRLRGKWFKEHRDRLSDRCAGMICVVASAEKRTELEKDLQKRSRGFGVPYLAAESMSAAEVLAHALMEEDRPRIAG